MMKFTCNALAAVAVCFLIVASPSSASYKFVSTWKAPGSGPLNFAGKKVAALVMTKDENLRVSAEEALAREIAARGPNGVAAYKLIPREELTDKDKVKGWFERARVEGVVAMRIVGVDKETPYTPDMWSMPYYGNLWGYYGYGWGTVVTIGSVREDTILSVETLFFNVADGQLLWAGVSETTNPKGVGPFMKGLASAVVKELQKQGLSRKGSH